MGENAPPLVGLRRSFARYADIYLLVNPEIEKVLKEEERYSVMELEKRINRRIIIIAKNDFHLEQYEISLQ